MAASVCVRRRLLVIDWMATRIDWSERSHGAELWHDLERAAEEKNMSPQDRPDKHAQTILYGAGGEHPILAVSYPRYRIATAKKGNGTRYQKTAVWCINDTVL